MSISSKSCFSWAQAALSAELNSPTASACKRKWLLSTQLLCLILVQGIMGVSSKTGRNHVQTQEWLKFAVLWGSLRRFSAALTAFPGCSPRRVPGLGAGCAVPRCRGGAEAHWLPPAARGFPGGLRGAGLRLVLHRCAQCSLVLLPRGQPLRLCPEWGRWEDGQRLEVSACGPWGAAGWHCLTAAGGAAPIHVWQGG